MVIGLAGRRVDAPSVEAQRFPPHNVDLVRTRIRDAAVSAGATTLVSSAACGSDLLALDAAGALGLRRRIVLPFDRARFKRASVIDRPGPWGELFDRIVDEVHARGDLITMALETAEGDAAYLAATEAILDEAVLLAAASHEPAGAVVVWEGRSRGAGDLTDAFRRAAQARGLPVTEVLTV